MRSERSLRFACNLCSFLVQQTLEKCCCVPGIVYIPYEPDSSVLMLNGASTVLFYIGESDSERSDDPHITTQHHPSISQMTRLEFESGSSALV